MSKNWLPVRGKEGVHSRQAHADLPAGTYEREVSKEGFFGPAAFLYHRRPPTGWVSFEGPLRPRAFDLNGLNEPATSPWVAPVVLHNKSVEVRFWKLSGAMANLARNADGDQLIVVRPGPGVHRRAGVVPGPVGHDTLPRHRHGRAGDAAGSPSRISASRLSTTRLRSPPEAAATPRCRW